MDDDARAHAPTFALTQLPKPLSKGSVGFLNLSHVVANTVHTSTTCASLMPDLLPRAITPFKLAQLAQCLSRSRALQVRQRHDISSQHGAPDSLPKTQPTVSQDGQLMRSREHGFRSLPLSPLMSEKKPPSTKTVRDEADEKALADFQKEFAMNPFAHALATPIRQCNVTFVKLPTHYLLPFSTVIERLPPAGKGQPPKIRAHLQPGVRSEQTGETLGQTSYVLNRQDMVRHLSRKRHWTVLVTDRQKSKVASIAQRSPNAQKLVQNLWAWDDRVEATAALLENRVEKALMDAFQAVKTGVSPSAAGEKQPAFALLFSAPTPGEKPGESMSYPDLTRYDLPALLPAKMIESLKTDHDLADMTHVAKGPEALRARLALEKLKAHKEASEIKKRLPAKHTQTNSQKQKQEESHSEV